MTVLPMTNTPVETHVVVDEGEGPRAVHFQQWWVQMRAAVPAQRFVVAGMDRATPARGARCDPHCRHRPAAPSNPVVSIGIILGVPGVRDALRGTRAPVIGVSPLVSGRPVRGHADACLNAIGVPATTAAVATLYADFLDGWLVDESDTAAPVPDGVTARVRPLLMTDISAAADITAEALDLGTELIGRITSGADRQAPGGPTRP